jgi:hypothetical protein
VAATLAALVLLGSYLRVAGLSPWHLAWDEAWHLPDALQTSPLAVVVRSVRRQVHGPVGYLLWHATAQLTSDPFGLRFVSLLPGVMLIPTFYVLGREPVPDHVPRGLDGRGPPDLRHVPDLLLRAERSEGGWHGWLAAAYPVQLLSSRWPLLTALVGFVGIGLLVPMDAARYRPVRVDFDTLRADLDGTFEHLEAHAGEDDVVVVNRVGMLYLNVEERWLERRLEHVRHDPDHSRYEFDRWVAPGEEEHRFRGTTFWGCDQVHEWASFLRGGQSLLERCLEQLARSRGGRAIDKLWFLVEKPDLFLAFATADPIRSVPARAPGRRELERLGRERFWRAFFDDDVERFRAPTAGTFAIRWATIEGELGRDRRRPRRARPEQGAPDATP